MDKTREKTRENKRQLLIMMIDVAKAIQNSQAFPPPDHSEPLKVLIDVMRSNPEWDNVMANGFDIGDVLNMLYHVH